MSYNFCNIFVPPNRLQGLNLDITLELKMYKLFIISEMPDPIDHATGLEKKELLAALAGNDDPYHMKAIKRGVGTKEKPTLIPSAFDARILGCICKYFYRMFPSSELLLFIYLLIVFTYDFFSGHEDQTYVQWMWLYKDVPKRCECGHWYKLYYVEPFVDESILAMSDVH